MKNISPQFMPENNLPLCPDSSLFVVHPNYKIFFILSLQKQSRDERGKHGCAVGTTLTQLCNSLLKSIG
jgi:hypothetical protein